MLTSFTLTSLETPEFFKNAFSAPECSEEVGHGSNEPTKHRNNQNKMIQEENVYERGCEAALKLYLTMVHSEIG